MKDCFDRLTKSHRYRYVVFQEYIKLFFSGQGAETYKNLGKLELKEKLFPHLIDLSKEERSFIENLILKLLTEIDKAEKHYPESIICFVTQLFHLKPNYKVLRPQIMLEPPKSHQANDDATPQSDSTEECWVEISNFIHTMKPLPESIKQYLTELTHTSFASWTPKTDSSETQHADSACLPVTPPSPTTQSPTISDLSRQQHFSLTDPSSSPPYLPSSSTSRNGFFSPGISTPPAQTSQKKPAPLTWCQTSSPVYSPSYHPPSSTLLRQGLFLPPQAPYYQQYPLHEQTIPSYPIDKSR
jgi:hypothetical protein